MAKQQQELEQQQHARKIRPHFRDAAALERVLQGHVVVPDFLRYAESFQAEIDKKAIKKHELLVQQLHALAPNMVFTQKALEQALGSIGLKRKWFRQDSDRKDWAETLGLRLRVMCRHFQQSWLKARGSTSTWIRSIIAVKDKEPREVG